MNSKILIFTGAFFFSLMRITVQAQPPPFQWANAMGSSASPGEFGQSIKVDNAGNSFVTGAFAGTIDFDPGPNQYTLSTDLPSGYGCFIAKYNNNGALVWAKKIEKVIFNYAAVGQQLFLDAFCNVFVGGWFAGTCDFNPGIGSYTLSSAVSSLNPSQNTSDGFILKLDSAGNFVWAKAIGGGGNDYVNSVSVDANGSVYSAGDFDGICDLDPGIGTFTVINSGAKDVFVSKLDASGNYVWGRTIGGTQQDRSYFVICDNLGNIVVGGDFVGTSDFDPGPGSYTMATIGNGLQPYIVKLSSGGAFLWAQNYVTTGATWALAADNAGNIYATGHFNNITDFDAGPGTYSLGVQGGQHVFTIKLSPIGNIIWGKSFVAIWGTGITLDATGCVYISGRYSGIQDFDPGPGTFTIAASGGSDGYILKLDSSGNFIWAVSVGGAGSEVVFATAIEPFGNIYSTGWFQGDCDFDPGPGTYTTSGWGNTDLFVMKLGQCLIPAPPLEVLTSKKTVCAGSNFTLLASGSGTISWYSNLTSSNAVGSGTNYVSTQISPGTYTYYAEAYTCTNSAARMQVTLSISNCAEIEKGNFYDLKGHFYLHPNPAQNELHVSDLKGDLQFSSIELLNGLGQTVLKTDYAKKIDISGLHAGVYVLKFIGKNGEMMRKFVKE
jgi:hypothetical protein